MTFKQALLMIQEMKSLAEERSEAVNSVAGRSKEVMAVLDITRGIYG